MLEGHPIYEIPASSITNPPQDAAKTNPVKMMIEEPMYMIFNVALSSTWGAQPPNLGKPCRGDGKDPVTNKICDAFLMLMKIDYIRLYQDTSAGSNMQVGCDPKSHPTKQWIEDHIDSYQDFDNMAIDVSGKAFCTTNDDCTIASNKTRISTGTCRNKRCKCTGSSWTGPRCTTARGSTAAGGSSKVSSSYGPSLSVTIAAFGTSLFVTLAVMCVSNRASKSAQAARK